jgi:hypothetical protein
MEQWLLNRTARSVNGCGGVFGTVQSWVTVETSLALRVGVSLRDTNPKRKRGWNTNPKRKRGFDCYPK